MHGNNDNMVPYQQSKLLRDALQKAGVEVTLKIVEGAGHGFSGREIDRPVEEFLEKHLKQTQVRRDAGKGDNHDLRSMINLQVPPEILGSVTSVARSAP